MTAFQDVQESLRADPRRWLVTGAAGFIGSNLTEALLRLGQTVVGVDNYATGHRRNVEDVQRTTEGSGHFEFVEGDVTHYDTCLALCSEADVVLHQAALGSVPRSLEHPELTHAANVNGTFNMLRAAHRGGVERFVYAASSSTYGDHPGLPKREDEIGRPLSPYAATKYVNELYAGVFARCYGLECVGLRYFNVFGRRQDPDGPYAAVMPKWVQRLLAGEPCEIYGDGETSRDFCYIDNVIQANLLAAATTNPEATDRVYNVAYGERTTLNELFGMLRDGLTGRVPEIRGAEPAYRDFRPGDVRHSLADISRIRAGLGYEPTHSVADGLREALDWYADNLEGR